MIGSTILIILFYVNGCTSQVRNRTQNATTQIKVMSCGVADLKSNMVLKGLADIESYPWFGLLLYPIGSPTRTTTTVILITTQIAVAAALDIDYYPKHNFRAQSRVILGNKCTGPFIRVRDYTFHPDYTRTTYSSMALVQLQTRTSGINVYPICPPPEEFQNADEIYALTLVNDCYNSSMVMVHKMDYIDLTRCRDFYRRLGLDVETMWPSHLTCARGQNGGHCIWRSGTALVIRDKGQWKLLGLGTYGPGCESPARFLDYGMYRNWVKRSLARIGEPSITRIDHDHLILRRTYNNVQRFGPCDLDETKMELFTDRTSFIPPSNLGRLDQIGIVLYNVTLLKNINYQCINLRVWNQYNMSTKPSISLRRWCAESDKCSLDKRAVYFYVEIRFQYTCIFKISAFGTSYNNVDARKLIENGRNEWNYHEEPRIIVGGVSVLE